MTADEYKKVTDFESGLAEGHSVLVRWTCSGRFFVANATVEKVNGKSFVVILDQDVISQATRVYGAGHCIKVPSIDNIKGWSSNNRVEPVGGYK